MNQIELLSRLAQPAASRIVLLVIDGLGDIRTAAQTATALERANLPNLDALAARSALGRIVPVAQGVTPGSGPGHLALFGYDPMLPEHDIGRGVLEAMGAGIRLGPHDVAARGNFATADAAGNLTDRRAGRISTEECRRLVEVMRAALAAEPVPGLEVEIVAGEGHRFVLILKGDDLSPAVSDTDPQRLGVPPLSPEAEESRARHTVERLRRAIAIMERAIAGEPKANRILLRGFSRLPHLPDMDELYGLRCGAFAGYPLYRGVAAACGMEVVPCGKKPAETLDAVLASWERFDLFFVHVKQADAAGEDGDLDAKVRVLEDVDRELPRLLERRPDVVAVTGDHSTPAPMKLHSWHPVPLLLHGPYCFVDGSTEFTETAAARGHLGTVPSYHLMGLLLANAGRLAKFGA